MNPPSRSPSPLAGEGRGEGVTSPACPSIDNWEEVRAAARYALGEPIAEFIDQCRRGPEPESQLIAVLHRVQAQFGYLSPAQYEAVHHNADRQAA